MELSIASRYRLLIARLCGELDHHSVADIRESIDRELMRCGVRNLLLDFTDVSFMDSSGLGVIMGRYKKVTALGGKVFICGINDNIKRMLSMCGMDKILIFTEDIAEYFEEKQV